MATGKHLLQIISFILLQFLIDRAYVYIYPEVNPIRALLIGATAFVILFVVSKFWKGASYWIGTISIFSSAFLGALLVQGGYIVSKSALSGIVHILILVLTYLFTYVLNLYCFKKFSHKKSCVKLT